METTYTYKEQRNPDGSKKDSWTKTVTDNGTVIEKYMVYEDPYKSDFMKLFEKITPEEKQFLKDILK